MTIADRGREEERGVEVGLPAVGHPRVVARGPQLRLVRPGRTSPRPGRRSSLSADVAAREGFRALAFIMILVTALALGRVVLTARATEAAVEAGRLRDDIKSERLAGDLLEVDKSALATPSRIECIAGESLKMGAAPEVSYLALPAAPSVPDEVPPGADVSAAESTSRADVPARSDAARNGTLARVISDVMEMAAGEAQVMLVGDVSLSSGR